MEKSSLLTLIPYISMTIMTPFVGPIAGEFVGPTAGEFVGPIAGELRWHVGVRRTNQQCALIPAKPSTMRLLSGEVNAAGLQQL